VCGAYWKAIDVSHGPSCPKNLLEEAIDAPNGGLVLEQRVGSHLNRAMRGGRFS
jgi:hypothetical protein